MPPRKTAAAAKPMLPKANEVLIRMYGQGVGDCFLLAFPRAAGAGDGGAAPSPVYVVIDCGVVGSTPGQTTRMQTVVRDIRDSTSKRVDLLVLTHEHEDHVSAFKKNQALSIWKEIEAGALWLAWTEERGKPLPEALRTMRERQRLALAHVADLATRYGLEDRHRTVLDLMGFLGEDATDASPGFSFKLAKTVREAWNNAQRLAKGRVTYCEPGDVRPVPSTEVRAYVLGPPRDETLLKKLNPEKKGGEGYHAQSFSLERMANGRSGFNAFAAPLVASALGLDAAGTAERGAASLPHDLGPDLAAERELASVSAPFDRTFRVPTAAAEGEAVAAPETYRSFASYFQETNHWRRIDFDWLASAESFALQHDTLANNTSLVLAFELPPSKAGGKGKVLLFTGDAQAGNLLSWDTIPEWTSHDGAEPSQPKPDMDDLLGRVAFYKVGHHGSHNATLKKLGVDRMGTARTDPLTAFVPVSAPVARLIKGWCHMPLESLMKALHARTDGRVVFPNGNLWPLPTSDDGIKKARTRARVTVSPNVLEGVVREKDGKEIEGEVPVWVQTSVRF